MYSLTALFLAGLVSAYDIPDNLRQIYDQHRSQGCGNVIASGFNDGTSGASVDYCGDISGAIYLQTTGGGYADMDIDCDGANNSAGDCANDPTGQGQTAFKDQVSQFGIEDLDSNAHPYVVFGNTGFDPQELGMEPLSVMAVVCGDNLFYGIWGDTNGGDVTGEASISLAQMCFPNEGLTGDNGHTDNDVLYIGFTGGDAVPGSDADWTAGDVRAFEESIKELGDKLVANLSV